MQAGLSSAELLLVGPSIMERAWPHATDLLEECREYWEEYHTIDTLYYWIVSGQMQLWMANTKERFVGLVLSELRQYPLKTECAIVLGVGLPQHRDAWLPLLFEIEEWARQRGASTIYVKGRLGWEKLLKPLGYTRQRTIVQKALTPGSLH